MVSFINTSFGTNKICKGHPYSNLFSVCHESEEVVGVYESQSFSDEG
jgi:hypothetical protein